MTERALQRNLRYGHKIGFVYTIFGNDNLKKIKRGIFVKHVKTDRAKIWLDGNKNMCIKHCSEIVKLTPVGKHP